MRASRKLRCQPERTAAAAEKREVREHYFAEIARQLAEFPSRLIGHPASIRQSFAPEDA